MLLLFLATIIYFGFFSQTYIPGMEAGNYGTCSDNPTCDSGYHLSTKKFCSAGTTDTGSGCLYKDATNTITYSYSCTFYCVENSLAQACPYGCCNGLLAYQDKLCPSGQSCVNNVCKTPAPTQPTPPVPDPTVPTTPSCVPEITCDDWNLCKDGKQTRSCSDANKCGTTITELKEQNCIVVPIILPITEGYFINNNQCVSTTDEVLIEYSTLSSCQKDITTGLVCLDSETKIGEDCIKKNYIYGAIAGVVLLIVLGLIIYLVKKGKKKKR